MLGIGQGQDYLSKLHPKLGEKEAISIRLQLKMPDFLTYKYYFNMSVQLNVLSSYLTYTFLFDEVLDLTYINKAWQNELKHIVEKFSKEYQSFYAKVGEKGKSLTNNLREEIEQEMMKLPHILTTDDQELENQETEQVESLITKLREDVKKGDRVTFKLLQELQHKFEKMESKDDADLQEVVAEFKEDSKKQTLKLVYLLIEIFDLLDLVRTNALQKEDDAWTTEISNVVDKGLALLADYGIEEIQVLGQSFDGNTMEGIGTIELKDIEESLERYDVHSVFQRGFRFKHNEELIRRAKVITVY